MKHDWFEYYCNVANKKSNDEITFAIDDIKSTIRALRHLADNDTYLLKLYVELDAYMCVHQIRLKSNADNANYHLLDV
jgi:hypothetical protein